MSRNPKEGDVKSYIVTQLASAIFCRQYLVCIPTSQMSSFTELLGCQMLQELCFLKYYLFYYFTIRQFTHPKKQTKLVEAGGQKAAYTEVALLLVILLQDKVTKDNSIIKYLHR